MQRRRAATWLLSLPLMVTGSQVAHVLAYRLVYPDAQVRLRDLLATGHGYMAGSPAWLTVALGALGVVELLGIGWSAAGVVRGRRTAPVAPVAFALLPMIGFTLQEFLERWLAGATFPWWLVLQPTFRIGLVLQLPFALVMYVVARELLRVAERLGKVLAASPQRLSLIGSAPARWRSSEPDTARALHLFASCLGRAPPSRCVGTATA